ncbi:MAG: xanthine dehydrogenase family protein molybdopterin-binding subunit [Peptococcaceae bacterium]|nr:xanthine dehydrogenase family protein molybdopterin-binding subunit [Peptococcaceae bacterium]MDH7524808.1 xanthine dehydrogenase family protein molybdopterin-binding subunit [Peptococcaceae bacterium]
MKYIGKDVPRVDAVKKVTGSLRFAVDEGVNGMLHCKILRSKVARAVDLKIDTGPAREVPGVYAVLAGEDLPQPVPRFGPVLADFPLLADKEIKFHGQPLAVVLAEDEDVCAAALRLIRVECRELPAVTSIEEALKPGAPLVNAGSNVFSEYNYGWGDVEGSRSECACELENEYTFPMVHHFALERYSCLAIPLVDGGVEIRTPIQNPFILRRVVAACLGLEYSKVRVVATDIGGGFGGKGYAKIEPLAAYLALRTGRPVKILLSTEEGFFAARRLSSRVRLRTGFDRDGKIIYQDILADYAMGAFVDAAPRIVAKASFLACGPYRTPHARIRARAIYTNTTPATAFRGFGMPQLTWALESQMNEAAARLGIDPLRLRFINLPRKGEVLIPGDTPVDGDWHEGLARAAELIGWDKKEEEKKEKNTGLGIAIGIKNPIPSSVSHALVKLHSDGSATVAVGTTEMGQGARTVMAQFAAETLGIPLERVHVVMGDTLAAPFDLSTAASRSSITMGHAVVRACRDILEQVKEMAAGLASQKPEAVVIEEGVVKAGEVKMTYAELLAACYGPAMGEVVGRGIYQGKKAPGHPLGGLTDFWEVVFCAAKVRVDRETGKVSVLKLVNVSDIGKAVNPLQAKGQEEGGAVMGIGHTLMEQMVYDEHHLLVNGSALDYRIPTALDIPEEIKCAFVENQDGPGPFGLKGIGESGCFATAPAVAGAVYEAAGALIRNLPITAERIWREIKER